MARDISLTVRNFTETVYNLISYLSWLILLIFGWLEWRTFPFDTIVNSAAPGLLWRVGLMTYFASWVVGTKFDVIVQRRVYHQFPAEGRVPWHGIAVILLLAALAIILLWLRGDIRKFAVFFTIFLSLII